MRKIDLTNFNIVSIDKIIGLYDDYAHRQQCETDKNKSFKKFLIELTIRPKKPFEILIPEEFNNNEELTYDDIDEKLKYKIVNEGVTGIKVEEGVTKLAKEIEVKHGIHHIDYIETIIDGKIRYIARDAESKHISIEWHFNDYYTWRDANNIIKNDLTQKNDNPIYCEETQNFVNSLMFKRSFGDKIITWDYSKDIILS